MSTITLRDGSITLDPRLDAIFDKDPGNFNYPAMAMLPEEPIVHQSKSWPSGPVTDQGEEGACVGHGILGCAMCQPRAFVPDVAPDTYAFELYHEIQDKDDWQGCSKGASCPVTPSPEAYSGTSTKAGGKVAVERGLFKEYRWAFGMDEMLTVLATIGPVVLAVPWFESMYQTDNGLVVVSGKQVGRHCIYVPQVDFEAGQVEWQNSWGLKYGKNGRARVPFPTLNQLLQAEGEVMVPIYPDKPIVQDHSVTSIGDL